MASASHGLTPLHALCLLASLFVGCNVANGLVDNSTPAPELPWPSATFPAGSSDQVIVDSSASQNKSVSETFLPELAEPQLGDVRSPERIPTPDLLPSTEIATERGPESPAGTPQTVWGILDFRGFPVGDQMASNGVEFHQLFLLDLNFNIMLWREKKVYLFADSLFWGQKPAPGITNPTQGPFDFSKREFDFNLGAAWNYAGPWEARVFAYSFNNLNRGNSLVSPAGFNDGIGLENRYYIGQTYADLGNSNFDTARATFVSVGYYPSKTMEDGIGNQFKPGAFVRTYLTYDLWGPQYYAFGDMQFTTSRSLTPTLLSWDAGLAGRPFTSLSRLEFRIGSLGMFTLRGGDVEKSLYLSIRYVF